MYSPKPTMVKSQVTPQSKVQHISHPPVARGLDYPNEAMQKGSTMDKIKMTANRFAQLPATLARNFTGGDNFTQGKGSSY